MVGRIMRRSPLRAARITWGFVTKNYTRSAASAKDLFFSDDISAEDLNRCLTRCARLPRLRPCTGGGACKFW